MENWIHSLDQELWKGERTHDDGNQTEYEPQTVKNFIFDYITNNDFLPSITEIMTELDHPDYLYEDVELELKIYNHEEEVEFRNTDEEETVNEQFTSSI